MNHDSTDTSELGELGDVPLPKRKNELLTLLELFPDDADKRWDWKLLSANPNIPIEYIINHPNLPWSWVNVCENPNLTMSVLKEFLLPRLKGAETNWSSYWVRLSRNLGIKIQEIIESASTNPSLFDRDKSKQRFEWEWGHVVQRSDVTLEMLLQKRISSNGVNLGTWYTYRASSNPNVTVAAVLEHPELWDFAEIIRNPAIPITDAIIDHPRSQTGFPFSANLSSHPLLPFEWIIKYPLGRPIHKYYNWNWQELSANPGISVYTILANPKFPWKWEYVLANPTITAEQVESVIGHGYSSCTNYSTYSNDIHKFKQAARMRISKHPNIPAHFVIDSSASTIDGDDGNSIDGDDGASVGEADSKNLCNWPWLSLNPNLTAQIVIDNCNCPGKLWDWGKLSGNKFAFHESSLAAKQKQYHEQVDPAVWKLFSAESLSIESVDRSMRLPTALAKITFSYFSPL